MGTLAAGIVGGAGQDMLQQRQEGQIRDMQQREREGKVFTALLSSPDAEVRSMAILGMGQPPPQSKGLKGYLGIPTAHPMLDAIRQHQEADVADPTQAAAHRGMAALGAPPTPPTAASGVGLGAFSGMSGTPGGVQTTAPLGATSSSAAMPATAVTGATAGPPVQPGYQTTPRPGGGPPSLVEGPEDIAARQLRTAAGLSAINVGAARPLAYGQAAGGEEGKLEALQTFVQRSGGMGNLDPETLRAGRMVGLFPPPKFNYTDVNFEDLPANEQAQAKLQDAKAGPGFTMHRGYDAVTGEKEFSATSRPGFTTPEQFNSVIDALAPDTIAGKPNQFAADQNQQAKTQIAAMLASHNYAEANKTLDALRQTMAHYRESIDPATIAAQTAKAVSIRVEGQRGISGLSALDEDSLNRMADLFNTDPMKVPRGVMFDPIGRKQIIDRAAQRQPQGSLAANSAEFEANEKALTSMTQTLSSMSAFQQGAEKNIQQFLDLAKSIPDTGVPYANTPVRELDEKLLGSKAVAGFNAARQVALREVARVTGNPRLVGNLTQEQQKQVSDLASGNLTLGQFREVARVLHNDMANVQTSYQDQVQQIQGRIRGIGSATPSGPPPAPPATSAQGAVPPVQGWTPGTIRNYRSGPYAGRWRLGPDGVPQRVP